MTSTQNHLQICDLGTAYYQEVADLQEELRKLCLQGKSPDTLLFVEHPPVYTLGRRSTASEFPLSLAWCKEHGIEVCQTRRGGKVTFHNPGQLVVYPILKTTDVIAYVRNLEQVIIAALKAVGITAETREGKDFTGVWVANQKIASIGIHLAKNVTTHGFAINVTNDLEPFRWITACGLTDVTMTSVKQELDLPQPLAEQLFDEIKVHVAQEFKLVHQGEQKEISYQELKPKHQQ